MTRRSYSQEVIARQSKDLEDLRHSLERISVIAADTEADVNARMQEIAGKAAWMLYVVFDDPKPLQALRVNPDEVVPF